MSIALIIDDHPIVRQGCRRMLEDAGITTVLEAHDAASGYKLYRRLRPEAVIVDLSMQGDRLGGLPLIRRICSHDPSARILVLSMHSDPIIVRRALEAGATGYVLKDTSSEDLIKAFEKVRAGTPYLSDELARQVALLHMPARENPLAKFDSARAANPVAFSRRQALQPPRRGSQCQLQNRGQRHLPAQTQTSSPQPAGFDAHRCAVTVGDPIARRGCTHQE